MCNFTLCHRLKECKRATSIAVAIVGRGKTIEREMEKRSHKQRSKTETKNWSKEVKSDNFCYHKVGRVITKWEAIEISPILNSQNLMYPISQFNEDSECFLKKV